MSRLARLRGAPLYLAISVPFLAIPLPLLAIGWPWNDASSTAIVAAVIAGVVAVLYVRRRYFALGEPRGFFFGMLLSAIELKAAFSAWIGYLVVANRHPFGLQLPLPPEPVRLVINAVGVIVLLTGSVYYAVTIALERREADREDEAERQVVLERLNHPPGENR